MTKIMRIHEVAARVGLCKASLYNMIKAGGFPSGIRLTKRAVGWRAEEVEEWIEGRERA